MSPFSPDPTPSDIARVDNLYLRDGVKIEGVPEFVRPQWSRRSSAQTKFSWMARI